MRIGKIVGTVTLSRWHPSMTGARYKLAVPLSWDNLLHDAEQTMDEQAVYDDLGAGIGDRVAMSEGREAAMPFYPEVKPIDAYNAAILDRLNYDRPAKDPEDMPERQS